MEFLESVQGSEQNIGAQEHPSVQALQRLVAHHYAVARTIPSSSLPEQQGESLQGLEQLAHARQEVLDSLMHKLDAAVNCLSDTLDDVPDQQPMQPDPQEVLAYAHRLRMTTFAKMGTISLPPAPQPWHWASSTLHRFSQQAAAATTAAAATQRVQSAAKVPAAAPAAAQPKLPTAPAPAYQEGYTLLDGTPLPVVQPPAPEVAAPLAAPVPVRSAGGIDLGLILNPDMEEVSYTDSEEESDDEFS